MGRIKRNNPASVQDAEKRLAGLLAINPKLDLGNGLSVSDYQDMIAEVKDMVTNYNQELSSLDALANTLDEKAQELSFLNRRMLAAVGSAFGFDSNEYEMAGGTRRSDVDRSNSDSTEISGNPVDPNLDADSGISEEEAA
jgi:hypothetical protein